MLANILFRLRALFRRGIVEQELDEELRAHLDHETRRYLNAGMPPAEAARRARIAMGGLELVKEQCRELRGTALMEELAHDLRYAFRVLRRSPGFTTMAVVSLALGVGANTAIFTLLDAVMLRSLPVRSPHELVSVGDAARPTALREGAPMVEVLSYPLYERLRDGNRVFTGLLASGRTGRVEMAVDDGGVEEIRGRFVSDNYFDVLGVVPVAGRSFRADEHRRPAAEPAIVISHDFWERRFARDPAILGRTLRLNGSPFVVIGVGPRQFTGEVVGSPADVWIPLSMQPQVNPGHARLDRRDSNWLLGIGRLQPGVSVEMARTEMTRLTQEALIEFAGGAVPANTLRTIRAQRMEVQPGARGFSWIRKNVSTLLFTLMAVVGSVLVIACANVANLLLARAASRQKEIAMRLAIGASRSRLIRQLLTEGAVLAAVGGAAGLLLAGWGGRVVSVLASRGGPNPVPFDVDVTPNITVLAFTVVVSMLTAILFGLVPAMRSTSIDVAPALKDHARSLSRSGWPLGKLLVIGQLALAVPMLIGAGLFVRSLANLEALDVGYSRDNLVLLKADLAARGTAPAGRWLSLTRASIERLNAIPGVLGATASENGLFSGIDSSTDAIQVDGFQPTRPSDSSCSFDQVGPRYFQIVGVPILGGRDFDDRDTAGAPPAVIINETMARFYFGRRDAIGESIRNANDRYRIVGVVKDNRQRNLKGANERRFYLPLSQSADRVGTIHFAIRTRDDPARMIPVIRRELQAFDRNLNIASADSARVLMAQSISEERTLARLSGFFGALAVLLAAAGLYGVMSYATARRAGEIGLRMALGADRGQVIRMVLRETLVLMAAGLVLGLPAAALTARLIGAMLVGVSPTDPVTAGGAILVMMVVGVSAGLIPARRAARIDPLVALRQE